MDPSILTEWGLPGGLLALAVWAIQKQWTRNNELSDARHTDQKLHTEQLVGIQREHTQQILENSDTLRRALDVVEGK